MKQSKILILFVGLGLLVINLDAARRGMGRGDGGMGRGNGMAMLRLLDSPIAEELGLSDAQKKEIRTFCTANAEQNVTLQNQNNLLRLELNTLMAAEKRDYAKIKTIMGKMSENRSEQRINGMKNRDKLMNILTPEQRKMISERLGSRMDREHRFNPREGRRDRMPRNGRMRQNDL